MEIFTDNCKLPSGKHTRDELSIASIGELDRARWGGGGGGRGRAHYRLEFLESRPRNINRYWRVGRGLIVNVSTMIRVAKSREGLNVVEMAAADRDFRSEFRNRSFKWVLSVLERQFNTILTFFFVFLLVISRFLFPYFCSRLE